MLRDTQKDVKHDAKNKTWGWELKCSAFRMHSNLSNYQFKINCYIYRSIYMTLIVTTNQNLTIDTQKIKRNEPKHNI